MAPVTPMTLEDVAGDAVPLKPAKPKAKTPAAKATKKPARKRIRGTR